MKRFFAIWAGQLVSVVGSSLTSFGLAVWVYLETGELVDLAMVATAAYLPSVVVAPVGGVLADRLDRRRLMLAADAGSAVMTALMFWCVASGILTPLLATALVFVSASFNALQWPAYEAAMVDLVPKSELGRANGLVELSRAMSQLVAPLVAGALFGVIGLGGIIVIDLASFAVGVIPLLVLRIPQHNVRLARVGGRLQMVGSDIATAWRYVMARPGLVAMLVLFFLTNFTFAAVELLLKPVILSFGSPLDLGLVLSAVGVGMVTGSIVLSAWGGPRRRVLAILFFQLVEGLSLVAGGLRPSLVLLCAAGFAYGLVIPLVFGCARVIWQIKVPSHLQGRVTALRNAFITLAIPLGYAVATPLANALESAMATGGSLADSVGLVIGVGQGRGSALVVVFMGLITCVTAAVVFTFAPYRNIETSLPDEIQNEVISS